MAGPHPDCAIGPGESRKAHEAVDLHLAAPTSAHPRRSHLSARVSLYSSLQKKPTLCHFTTPGGGSGVVCRDQFSRSADLQYPERCVAFGVGARVALLGLRGRGGPMVAPTGFGPTAVRQEGRPGLSRAAPSTAWVDTAGNAKRTARPLALLPQRLCPCEHRVGSGAETQAITGLEVPARTGLQGRPRLCHLQVPEASCRLPGQAAGPCRRRLATGLAISQQHKRI